jgi:hypothetical protein
MHIRILPAHAGRGNGRAFRTNAVRLSRRFAEIEAASEAKDEQAADAWAMSVHRRELWAAQQRVWQLAKNS